jgi:hypothetical protein
MMRNERNRMFPKPPPKPKYVGPERRKVNMPRLGIAARKAA